MSLDLSAQLAALEAVRAGLETSLGGDENWRALHSGTPGALDRRDRDARLVKALQGNPLYVAWERVDRALAALGDIQASGGGDAAVAAEDVDAWIRADAEDIVRFDQQAADAARGEHPAIAAKAESEPAVQEDLAARLNRIEADIEDLFETAPAEARRALLQSGAAAVGGRFAHRRPGKPLPPLRPIIEPTEAKVTFVTRDRAAPPRPAQPPQDTADGNGQAAADGFVPPVEGAEEAEVTIVKHGEGNPAPVRRFLAALSGE